MGARISVELMLPNLEGALFVDSLRENRAILVRQCNVRIQHSPECRKCNLYSPQR